MASRKTHPKSRKYWKAKGWPLKNRMIEVGARISLWRDRGYLTAGGRSRATAFIAHVCLTSQRSKRSPQKCGVGRGKNPRAAIADAARQFAATMERRTGGFAGY